MSKTKKAPLFSTSNTIHSDVLSVHSLPQKSKKQSTPPPPPNINCTNNKREVNKRKHIVLSLLIVVATILIVGCPEPTKDKGSTAPTIKQLLSSLATAVDMPETNQAEKVKKQNKIQSIYALIKKTDPKYKPKDKDELATFIKAEMWAQGKDGKQDLKANLDDIDTSQVDDMSYLFSDDVDKGYELDEWEGAIPLWTSSSDRGNILTHKNIVERIEKILLSSFENEAKQEDIQALLSFIDNPDYKHKPKTKDELVTFIKAEIWAQGKGGTQDWKANLNKIDTSLVTDMSYLFSDDKDKGKGLHEYSGLPPLWALSKPTKTVDMYKGSQAPLPTWHSIGDLKTAVEKTPPQQDAIKALIKKITKDNPDYKHRPTNKGELVMFIKAEIWAQGKDGKQNWKSNLNNIDTSLITDMRLLFGIYQDGSGKYGYELSDFNGKIDKWDVSSVTTTYLMFANNKNFNRNINNWDVSKLKNAGGMFYGATAFNQPLKDWNVGKVTTMFGMFWGATAFNQLLNKWDVSSVTNTEQMFYKAKAFNQDLDRWNVEKLEKAAKMFLEAVNFNGNVGTWKLKRIKNMRGLFHKATAFNQRLVQWGQYLKDKDGKKYRDIETFGMFQLTKIQDTKTMWGNTPQWYRDIPK